MQLTGENKILGDVLVNLPQKMGNDYVKEK